MNIKPYILSIMKDEKKTPDAYIVKVILSIISIVYKAILHFVYLLYKIKVFPSYRVLPKVISVGNITLGGTGKTPLSILLAEDIRAMGRKPAVLSRGYGNDESQLLKEKLNGIPVLIGRDRVKNANRASCEFGRDCVILDDGFQHYRIKRDLDIVLIDATAPFGNMRLFPRGILREPITRLKEADIAILTKSDMGFKNVISIRNSLRELNKKIEILESFYQPLDLKRIYGEGVLPLSYIADKKIALLAGIANPNYFDWMVGELTANIKDRFYYPDHYHYSEKDITYISRTCIAKNICAIVTTEKDAVRLKRLKAVSKNIETLALRINFRFSSNEETVASRLHSVFNS
jgi:tetraacyldisaccharide 4'-kinase